VTFLIVQLFGLLLLQVTTFVVYEFWQPINSAIGVLKTTSTIATDLNPIHIVSGVVNTFSDTKTLDDLKKQNCSLKKTWTWKFWDSKFICNSEQGFKVLGKHLL